VASGQHGLETIKTAPPDMVVLDLGLPDIDGLQVLQRLRKLQAHMPVLILTARHQLEDRVKGLESGADDYLPKPFEMAELVARLRVIERRLTGVTDAHISIRNVTLYPQHHLAKIGEENLELSRREFMLLKTLMENAGKVQTRSALEARLYSWDEEVASNSLEVHIHNLRKKLGADFIKTVRGVGYTVQK
jgi:DNA-binding response OmpR family regulator